MRHLELEKCYKEYLEYLEIEKGRSLKTLDNYRRYLDGFFVFAKPAAVSDITDDSVRKFRMNLNRRNLNRKTQNYYLIALRAFLKYLAKRGEETLSPEAIELAKSFGGESSGKFVNGVLGTVYREIGEPGKEQTSKKKEEIKSAESSA